MNFDKLNKIWKNKDSRLKIGIPIISGKYSKLEMNEAYFSYVYDSGYEPIPISYYTLPNSLVDISMLLLPGGADIDPTRYWQQNEESYKVDMIRDEFESNLIYRFLLEAKPIFGICRGMQLLFREFTMHKGQEIGPFRFSQDLNQQTNTSLEVPRNTPIEIINVDPILLNKEGESCGLYQVNSIHHQGIVAEVEDFDNAKELDGARFPIIEAEFQVLAYNINDEDVVIVEAFDLPTWKARGVQWHPEELKDTKLLQAFVAQQLEIT